MPTTALLAEVTECRYCRRERQINAWCVCPTSQRGADEFDEHMARLMRGVPVGPLPAPIPLDHYQEVPCLTS